MTSIDQRASDRSMTMCPPRGERHLPLHPPLHLLLEVELSEQGPLVPVHLELPLLLRVVHVEEGGRLAVGGLGVHQHFRDVRAVVVPQRADHDVLLFVEQRGGLVRPRPVHGAVPQLQQVGEVGLQVLQRPGGADRADDEPEVVGIFELLHLLPDPLALLLPHDLLRDAVPLHPEHHHHVAAGDADVRGDRGPLDRRLLLRHLDEDLHAGAQRRPLVPLVPRPQVLHQGAGAIFVQRHEAVAAAAELDERRLDRVGDVDDLRLVDVPLERLLALVLDLVVVEVPLRDDRHPVLLGVKAIDQHHLLRAGPRRLLPLFLLVLVGLVHIFQVGVRLLVAGLRAARGQGLLDVVRLRFPVAGLGRGRAAGLALPRIFPLPPTAATAPAATLLPGFSRLPARFRLGPGRSLRLRFRRIRTHRLRLDGPTPPHDIERWRFLRRGPRLAYLFRRFRCVRVSRLLLSPPPRPSPWFRRNLSGRRAPGIDFPGGAFL